MFRFPAVSAPAVSLPRAMFAVAFGVAVLAGCSGENPYDAAKNASTTSVVDAGTDAGGSVVGDNAFLPDRDIGDCVGTLERPDCGSPEKGTKGTYLTFAALIGGLAFIFWRISIGIRNRDAVVNNVPEPTRVPDVKGDPDPPA